MPGLFSGPVHSKQINVEGFFKIGCFPVLFLSELIFVRPQGPQAPGAVFVRRCTELLFCPMAPSRGFILSVMDRQMTRSGAGSIPFRVCLARVILLLCVKKILFPRVFFWLGAVSAPLPALGDFETRFLLPRSLHPPRLSLLRGKTW